MKKNGFTLVEILIAVAIIAIIAVIGMQLLNPKPEAELSACCAKAEAMRTLVEQAAEQTYPRIPTRDEVMQIAGNRWDDDYWYTWDEPDANAGHGNDLDFCDEDNPSGNLSHVGGECYDIRWIVICNHDHSGAEAGYVGVVNASNLPDYPIVFGGNPDHKFVKDLHYWKQVTGADKEPNLAKWWGR